MIINRDMVGGISAVLIGILYLYFATQIRASALDDSFGPGGMPRAYGILMVLLGLIITVGGLIKAIREKSSTSTRKEWAGQGNRVLWAAGLLAIGVVYLLIVPVAGYAIAIGLLLAATGIYQGSGLTWKIGLVALGGAAALWAIFVLLLGVSMPPGVFHLF